MLTFICPITLILGINWTSFLKNNLKENKGYSQISSSWHAISELRDFTRSDVIILLAARHKRAHPALTPASKVGTWFTYPRGMEGWVDLGVRIMPRPGMKATTARSKVWCPNHCTTKTLRDLQKFCGGVCKPSKAGSERNSTVKTRQLNFTA